MKFIISAHPVNRQLQDSIGIYSNSTVSKERVGDVLEALANAGHIRMNISVDSIQEEIRIHCKQCP